MRFERGHAWNVKGACRFCGMTKLFFQAHRMPKCLGLTRPKLIRQSPPLSDEAMPSEPFADPLKALQGSSPTVDCERSGNSRPNRDRGQSCDCAPPTPPDIRVRIW